MTVCPLTLPSHATMLTGVNPPEHGIRTNGTSKLPEDLPTLSAELQEKGFATGAFLAAFALEERFGLKIARRTVTKYRKALGIASSRQRRIWT